MSLELGLISRLGRSSIWIGILPREAVNTQLSFGEPLLLPYPSNLP
jgi:hypothetical protein